MNDIINTPRILVIKLGALGDFIQALGPMKAIREHHPDAYITLMTTAPFENFAKECGYCDDIWIDERPKLLAIKKWIDMKADLNNTNFTRIYDLQNNDRTNLYFKLLHKKNRPEWVGTAKGASHRNTSKDRTAGHAFDGHVQSSKLAGIEKIGIDNLSWMKADLTAFPTREPYVLLVPGCAPSRPQKRWPPEKYGRLAKLLFSLGYKPLILGTKPEKSLADIIVATCPESRDLTGQTSLHQIASLARNAAGAIGNDTGPMHLIGATGCPSLVLFSSDSDPQRHLPKGKAVQYLQKDEIETIMTEEVIQAFKPAGQPEIKTKTLH